MSLIEGLTVYYKKIDRLLRVLLESRQLIKGLTLTVYKGLTIS